jgi:hypothetical protein
MVVTEISLVGWIASALDTATVTMLATAAVCIILLPVGIFLLHRQIERRIDRIGSL